jgi:glucose-6-phosphate isomerase
MTNISLQLDKVYNFVSDSEIKAYKQVSEIQNIALHEKTGKGNDFLGWVDLPSSISEAMLSDVEKVALKLQSKHLEVFVVIGIGG